MERKINNELRKWKNDTNKKPLLLYGIPGCGKTYSVLEFGKEEYKNTIYFDCFNNLELSYVFEKNNTVDKLIRGLSAISLETIMKEETLIVFDNVNEKIFNAVKKLFNFPMLYNIVMITSSLSFVKKSTGNDFMMKKMGLVSFDEYLKFIGKEQLIDFIKDSFKNDKPMPFHSLAMEAYNDFVLTGGYPNAIVSYNDNKNYYILNSVHDRNIKVINNELLKIDNLINIRRSIELLNNVSIQLLKDNKKFMYGLIKSGARAKDYDDSIKFLEDNNIIIKSCKVSELTSPLSKIKDTDSFKLYYNDSGILYKKMNVSANRLFTNNKLLEILYENNVVSVLNYNGFNIYYYHSDGKAYIDFVIQTRTGKIIPIELVKEDFNTKSKSLGLALNKYNLSFAIRFTTDNFKYKNNVKYVPYYAAFCINEGM